MLIDFVNLVVIFRTGTFGMSRQQFPDNNVTNIIHCNAIMMRYLEVICLVLPRVINHYRRFA